MKLDRINYYLIITILTNLNQLILGRPSQIDILFSKLLSINYFILNKGGFHQKRLLSRLFKSYDLFERPVLYENERLRVDVGLSIQQIVDLVITILIIMTKIKKNRWLNFHFFKDEKKQTIIFSGWLDMVKYFSKSFSSTTQIPGKIIFFCRLGTTVI